MFIIIVFFNLMNLLSIPSILLDNDVMYIGAENKIAINLNGAEAEDVHLKVNIGTLRKINDTTYIYMPQQTDEEIKFKLYHKKIVCDIKIATLKVMAEPILVFEGEVNGQIKRSQLNQLGKLIMKYEEGYPEHLKGKVQQFGLIITNGQGMFLLSTNVRGDELDERTKKDLERLNQAQSLMINNVNIVSNNSVKRMNISKTIEIID